MIYFHSKGMVGTFCKFFDDKYNDLNLILLFF